jgi:hypothetical protein
LGSNLRHYALAGLAIAMYGTSMLLPFLLHPSAGQLDGYDIARRSFAGSVHYLSRLQFRAPDALRCYFIAAANVYTAVAIGLFLRRIVSPRPRTWILVAIALMGFGLALLPAAVVASVNANRAMFQTHLMLGYWLWLVAPAMLAIACRGLREQNREQGFAVLGLTQAGAGPHA